MKTHQKYFSVKDSKTDKIVKYITVANIVSKDNGEKILAGNNRVLNSRLSDASFFWKIDKDRIAKYGFEGFAKDLELSKTKRGDLFQIKSAGGYGEVMASDYNLKTLYPPQYSK